MSLDSKRDYYAGAMIALIGAGAAYQGSGYGIGTLSHMRPGFFPTAIGIAMVLVGAAIAATAGKAENGAPQIHDPLHTTPASIDIRGWLAVVGGAVLFMALASYAGLLPAIFACVFFAALGNRTTSWKEAVLLAAGVTVFGIALFAYGLKIPIPILKGM
jgi:putative tricarboxylic transport membrane protein